ncbi:hypothetical protein [Streptomyces sp. TE33382]
MVRQAIESPLPLKRQSPPRPSVLESVKGFIDAMPREGLDAPPKQKHTIVRIMKRPAAEHDSEPARQTTVWEYVTKRRPEIKAAALAGGGIWGPRPRPQRSGTVRPAPS